jgi:hypothetical protein
VVAAFSLVAAPVDESALGGKDGSAPGFEDVDALMDDGRSPGMVPEGDGIPARGIGPLHGVDHARGEGACREDV